MIKCDYCGKWFDVGNTEDGLPNGFSFVKQDGSTLTVCTNCVIDLGRGMKSATQEVERLHGEGDNGYSS